MNETLHNPDRFFEFGQWPIVVARMPGFEHFSMTDWIAGFDAALDRNEAFVAVLDIAGFLKDPRSSPPNGSRPAESITSGSVRAMSMWSPIPPREPR